jgi:acyl-CoA synthetase (NDP forming)
MFGLGGIFVEVIEDVVFRLAPLDREEARAMIGEIRGARLLRGFRGRAPVNEDAVVDLLVRVSELAADRPEISEIDINPVMLLPQGALIADARVVVDRR